MILHSAARKFKCDTRQFLDKMVKISERFACNNEFGKLRSGIYCSIREMHSVILGDCTGLCYVTIPTTFVLCWILVKVQYCYLT